MKHHVLFSSEDKSKKNIVLSAAILLGAIRVKALLHYKSCMIKYGLSSVQSNYLIV